MANENARREEVADYETLASVKAYVKEGTIKESAAYREALRAGRGAEQAEQALRARTEALLNEQGYTATINPAREGGGMGKPIIWVDQAVDRWVNEEKRAANGKPARPTVKKDAEGDIGEYIANVQMALNQANPDPKTRLSVDGQWGPKTEDAVRAFQRQNGLKDDGEVGPRTWAKLDEITQAQNQQKQGPQNQPPRPDLEEIRKATQRFYAEAKEAGSTVPFKPQLPGQTQIS